MILETVRLKFHEMFPFPGEVQIDLLKISENMTFTVSSLEQKAILRVNRPSYHTERELLSELQWMNLIRRDSDIPIPRVFPGRNGSPLQSFVSPCGKVYFCSLFSFLTGRIVRQLEGKKLLEKTKEIGTIAAKLHLQVQSNPELKNLPRFRWDFEDLLGPHARWGSWKDYPGLTKEDSRLFQQTSDIMKVRLSKYGKSPDRYGLIHSDLHLSNVIVSDGKLQVIDFDDCGYGWFLYDLGCSLVEYSDNLEQLVDAWLTGYQSVRPLSKEDLSEVPGFLLLRRIVRLAWLGSHSDSDTAKTVGLDYLEKTRRLAEEFVLSNSAGS